MTEIEALQDDFESAKIHRPTYGELINLIYSAYHCLAGACNSLKAAYDRESEYNRAQFALESAINNQQRKNKPSTKANINHKKQ